MTLNWFIFDGIPKWLLERLLNTGELPYFKKIIDSGSFFDTKPSYPNCQTPAAMATLLTGQSQQEHKINGYWMQGKEDHRKYVNSLLQASPEGSLIWEDLSKENIEIDLIQIPWYKETSKKINFVGGINNRISREKYYDLSNRDILNIEDEVGIIKAIKKDAFTWQLESNNYFTCINDKKWTLFTSNKGHSAWYRVVNSNEKEYLIRTAVWEMVYSSTRNDSILLNKTIGKNPFLGETLGGMYRTGLFGKQFYIDGDGTAENLYLDLYKLSFEYYKLVLNEIFKNRSENKLRIIYVPFTDDIGHELIGFLNSDIEIPKKYEMKAFELLLKVYKYADQLLEIAYEEEKDFDFVISSDHGMNGVSTMFHPNDLLVCNGYAQKASGDFENTNEKTSHVIYHVVNNGFIYENTKNHDNKILKAALTKLIDYRHPISKKKMVKELVDINGEKVNLQTFNDKKCYIVFAENVMPNPELTKNLSIISKPNRSATHHTYNSDKLNGIFISSFKLKESSIKSNTEVKSIILKKMRGKNCQ